MSTATRGRSAFPAGALASLALLAAMPGALAGVTQVGSSGVGDPFFPQAGNGGYQVESYDLDLAYDPGGHRLRAKAAIRAVDEPNGLDLSRFNLDYRGPRIASVRVGGAPAAVARDGAELVVTPAEQIADGSAFRIVARYAGRPGTVTDPDGSREGWVRTADGAIALGEPLGSTTWFPCNNHPTDKARFRITLRTPRPVVGISNGRLVSRSTPGRATVMRWRQGEPMAPYLAVVAIGRFRIDRGRIGGVPYVGAVDAPPSSRRRVVRSLRQRTRSAHTMLQSVAGPYPFGATGGIVAPSPIDYALETQTRPYYPSAPSTDLVVHEIAHEWYGNSVSLAEWDEIWLNEGFATYMEWVFAERRGGQTSAQRFDGLYAAHGPGDGGFWNPPPAAVPGPEKLFAESVYTRGAMALQVLREELGDADFFALLAEWATENQHGTVDTDDLRALIESYNSGTVPPLFEDWITDPGKPAPPA
jgi:aminopeptidase N